MVPLPVPGRISAHRFFGLKRFETELREQRGIRTAARIGSGQQLLAGEDAVRAGEEAERLRRFRHALAAGGEAHHRPWHGDARDRDGADELDIVDRAKDMIIRGGENIYSIEVENALYEHPAVVDAALIGLPHKTLGEEPAAVVHLAPGAHASEAELQDWVRARLAPFKVPVRIAFAPDMLPRNANGKILKRELRGLF